MNTPHLRQTPRLRRRVALLALLMLLAALLAAGTKGWFVVQRAQKLYASAQALSALLEDGLHQGTVVKAVPLVSALRADAAALREEAGPLLPLAGRLGWVPRYGPMLVAAEPLLDVAVKLSVAADEGLQALAPLLTARDLERPFGQTLVSHVAAVQPQLARARAATARALELWPRLPLDTLPAQLRSPLARIGGALPDALDGIDLLVVLPDLLGHNGPKQYLIYAQNPDELRPTGGFISGAGTVTLSGGQVSELVISDSGQLDDPSQYVYPDPPAALRRYIGFELWLLRDSNWSPDFPTAAQTGMELYQLTHGEAVDGVLAVNPAALRLVLAAIGPVVVDGATVSADTVIAYIRKGWHGRGAAYEGAWADQRKSFLGPLSHAIVARLQEPAGLDLPRLARVIEQSLRERHVQIYVREPIAEGILARRGWDGGLRAGGQDFLMVVDANLGYNKVNPKIDQAITYTVDLGDSSLPVADLQIRYRHQLRDGAVCDQALGFEMAGDIRRYEDWMVGCYWNYSRVLSPRGIELLSGTSYPTPGEWMLTGKDQPGAVTLLGQETGVSVLQTFFVVPLGEQREIALRYRLPPTAVVAVDGGKRYQLHVQKQSGSNAPLVTVQVRLPPGSALEQASPAATLDQATGLVSFTFRLTHDQPITLTFR